MRGSKSVYNEPMTYIYHGVPEEMKGNELIPLSRMQSTYLALSDKYLEKYKGREEIIERTIPLLDCLWNDVVQLLPLHPRKVFECQKELGLIDTTPSYKYFEIDLDLLNPDKTVVYFKTAPGEENVTVKWLRDVDLSELQEVPEATINYYQSLIGTGEPVFNYQFIPHIIYKGSVDIRHAGVVRVA